MALALLLRNMFQLSCGSRARCSGGAIVGIGSTWCSVVSSSALLTQKTSFLDGIMQALASYPLNLAALLSIGRYPGGMLGGAENSAHPSFLAAYR